VSEQIGSTETPHNISDGSSDLLQDRKNHYSIDDPRLVERYIKNELHIIFDVTFSDGEKYAALFQRETGVLGGNESAPQLWSRVTPRMATEIDSGKFGSLAWQERMKMMPCYGGEQQPVLVDIVKVMETPERLVSSLVWFERMDKFLSLLPQAVYFSTEKLFSVLLGTACNRESGGAVRNIASGSDHLIDRVVQRRAEVLQSIPNNGGELGGDRRKAAEIISALSRFQIVLSADGVWVLSEKNLASLIKLNDVFVGPFELY